jgi:hypothetical protein
MITNLLNNHETIVQNLCKDRYAEVVVIEPFNFADDEDDVDATGRGSRTWG